MADVVWVKHQAEWNKQFNSTDGMVGQDIASRGQTLASLARTQVGKKSFRLVRSINSRVRVSRGEVEAVVGSDVEYALLHHEGTAPHVIRATPGKRLRFKQNGVIRYATAVNHPGTEPNRYLTDNLPKVV